LKITDG